MGGRFATQAESLTEVTAPGKMSNIKISQKIWRNLATRGSPADTPDVHVIYQDTVSAEKSTATRRQINSSLQTGSFTIREKKNRQGGFMVRRFLKNTHDIIEMDYYDVLRNMTIRESKELWSYRFPIPFATCSTDRKDRK